MNEEKLIDFFLLINCLYFLTWIFFFFRNRLWLWVAILKMLGLFLVLTFQILASLVWFFSGLPAEDVLVYTLWSFLFGAIAVKFAREGLCHLFLVLCQAEKDKTEKINQYTFFFSRNGQDKQTWRITVVKKQKAD